eukprot:3410340-Prymnesium_polylepis.1
MGRWSCHTAHVEQPGRQRGRVGKPRGHPRPPQPCVMVLGRSLVVRSRRVRRAAPSRRPRHGKKARRRSWYSCRRRPQSDASYYGAEHAAKNRVHLKPW